MKKRQFTVLALPIALFAWAAASAARLATKRRMARKHCRRSKRHESDGLTCHAKHPYRAWDNEVM